MSERKNIDRLFQEKFKDFEVKPSDEIWENIEAKLDKKKKRRIVPFWWKLSGVAALFLIGFFVSKSIYNSNGVEVANPVVNGNNSNTKEKTTIENVHIKNLKENTIPTENPVVNEANINKSNQKSSKGINKNNSSDSSDNIITNNSDEVKNNVVAERKQSNHRFLKNKSNAEKDKAPLTQSVFEKSQSQTAQNTKSDTRELSPYSRDKQLAVNEKVQTSPIGKNDKETQIPTSDKKTINLDHLKGNINSKIATKEIENKKNDTAQKSSVANNELEELLNEKESKLKQESKRNRWQLTSNVAPVFLGSISNGSPIDSTLINNPKSYNTNVGFGLGVSYVVNKKLTVRTGLNKVNISYDTNDIVFFTGIQAKMLANVSPTTSSAMIQVQSNAVNNQGLASESELLPFENSFKNSGYLNQEIGYLEMPLEMTYSLFDKKVGLKIIGGFSSLFLQDNSITIVSEGHDTLLGRANNLNDVHFSTNLGLGIKYGFMKSFEFNLEPTIKYQLNTFSSNAGNFQPFIFGVYSGISYKF